MSCFYFELSLLTSDRWEEYTDEDGESGCEVHLNLVVSFTTHEVDVFGIVSVSDVFTLLLEIALQISCARAKKKNISIEDYIRGFSSSSSRFLN